MTLQKRDETIRVFPVIESKALRAVMSAREGAMFSSDQQDGAESFQTN
jgi:hypothetical protein